MNQLQNDLHEVNQQIIEINTQLNTLQATRDSLILEIADQRGEPLSLLIARALTGQLK